MIVKLFGKIDIYTLRKIKWQIVSLLITQIYMNDRNVIIRKNILSARKSTLNHIVSSIYIQTGFQVEYSIFSRECEK